MRAACAIASRCSTALVEPPSATVTAMAFSKALRVRMSEGRSPARSSCTTASPARRQSSRLAALTASCAELFGRLSPSASIAEAMVLAVYMPPQLPGPGIAVRSTCSTCCGADGARGAGADGLEHRDDVAPLLAETNRAAVDEHRRAIQARDGHRAARHVLVAPADGDDAVEALGAHDGLDRIGDHFARHQRVAHAGRSHRDAVRHRDGVERHALAARRVGAGAGLTRQVRRCACCRG